MKTLEVLATTAVFCLATAPSVLALQVSQPRVEPTKPTIYLSVERKDKDRVWFRINNNTAWAIAVTTISMYFYVDRNRPIHLENGMTVFALPADREISTLHYYLEREPDSPRRLKVEKLSYPDVSSTEWIAPKSSILFSAPASQLPPGTLVYVPFQYEWELSGQSIFNHEPEHRVQFRAVDL
jgi:hypothetical protein